MKKIGILVFLLIFSSCSKEFTEAEIKLFTSNGIAESTAQDLKSVTKQVDQLYTYDKEFNEVKAKGVLIKVKPNSGMKAVLILRGKLTDTPYQAYLYDNHYGYDDDEVAIVTTKDDIEYLKIIKTDGVNYNLTANDILKKYEEWKNKYKLRLIGAGRDWMEAEIKAKNVNWSDLAKEVYEFCPDVVAQGTGTVQALEAEMKKSSTLYLWWD